MGPYILQCQLDSHLQRYQAIVECIEALPEKVTSSKKKNAATEGIKPNPMENAHFRVLLSDTIMFPEGGGQPSDTGYLVVNENTRVFVFAVERIEDGTVWHYVDESAADVIPGTPVTVEVDWDKRLDHMEHHSAQHLITAMCIREYGMPTLSWNLSTDRDGPCTIDLGAPEGNVPGIDCSEMSKMVEKICNDAIKENIAVSASVLSVEELATMEKLRFKELPDTNFPIRVVDFDGLDLNLCCGTHVKASGELGSIKILGIAPMKKAGVSFWRLQFVAGNRVLRLLEVDHSIVKELTNVFSGCELVPRAQSLVNENKTLSRVVKSLLQEYAALLGPKLVQEATAANSKFVFHHQKDGTMDFIDAFLRSVGPCYDMLVFVVVGEEPPQGDGSGAFVMGGDPKLVGKHELQKMVLEGFQAKGGGKTRFQGKILAGNLTVKSLALVSNQIQEYIIKNA